MLAMLYFHQLVHTATFESKFVRKTMKVDVEVISKDTVQPSSPTPEHLRRYTLSFIDQITPQIFMPFLLFYPNEANNANNHSNLERCEVIKKSLSEALTRFYPLAGRVKQNLYVDCNDEGVQYVEAEANCRLSEFLEDPMPAEFNKFLPFELDDVNELALAVQVTTFNCGGMVIGLVFAHKVSDACSFFVFLNSWAAIARGSSDDIPPPRYESAAFFPPETSHGFGAHMGSEKNKTMIKRFVFDAAAIAALRAKYNTDNKDIENPRPSRVEALSSFIWSRFLAATQPEEDPNKVYAVFHIANLRTKLDPPLSEYYFGNMGLPTVSLTSGNTEVGFYDIITPVRDSIKKVNMNYVKTLQENGGHMNFMIENAEKFIRGEVISLAFTSLCRFPVYEADFGWGKPVWVGSAKLLYKNLVTFFDTKSGNGIEVWINLEEEEMAKFEVDKELLKYVSSAQVYV